MCGIVRFFSVDANECELMPRIDPDEKCSVGTCLLAVGFSSICQPPDVDVEDGFERESIMSSLVFEIDDCERLSVCFIVNGGTGDGMGSELRRFSDLFAVFLLLGRALAFGFTGACALLLLPYNDCDPYPSISGVGFVILLREALNALLLSSIDEAVFSKKLSVDSLSIG